MLPYIKIYSDFLEIVQELDNGMRGQLFLAIMQYANDEEPTNLTGAVKIAFLMVKAQIDRERTAYEELSEKRRIAGKSGAEKRWQNEAKIASDNFAIANNGKDGNCQEEKKRKEIKRKELSIPEEFSDRLKEELRKWQAYKAEKHDTYKEQGWQALMGRTVSQVKLYGEKAVIDLIEDCMGRGYKGIIWDILARQPQKPSREPSYNLDEWEKVVSGYVPKI